MNTGKYMKFHRRPKMEHRSPYMDLLEVLSVVEVKGTGTLELKTALPHQGSFTNASSSIGGW
jgi:hypothetical protein